MILTEDRFDMTAGSPREFLGRDSVLAVFIGLVFDGILDVLDERWREAHATAVVPLALT
jgi:hypothetical protein